MADAADPFALDGRTIVVTGFASGIGRATAVGCARAGATVLGLDIDAEGAAGTLERVEALGRGHFQECDLADPAAVRTAFEAFDALGADIDGLVNGAAVFVPWSLDSSVPRQPLERLDRQLWDRILAVNLSGAMSCAQEAARRMIDADRHGAIVNISSIAGASALGRGNLPYSAAKGGLHMMTKEMATEWGSRGIRVNAILPGHIRTENLQRILDRDPALASSMLEKAYAAIPMRRFGETSELAATIVFLLSDAAGFVNGVLLPVDGGNLAMNASGVNPS